MVCKGSYYDSMVTLPTGICHYFSNISHTPATESGKHTPRYLIFNLSSEVTNGIGMGVIDVIVIPPIPIMVILFLFSVYPALYPTEKFFKKRGSVNVVIEYQYIRKILFVFLISLIVTIVMIYFLIPIMNEQAISQYAQGMSDMEIYKQVPLIPLIESLTLWYLVFSEYSFSFYSNCC